MSLRNLNLISYILVPISLKNKRNTKLVIIDSRGTDPDRHHLFTKTNPLILRIKKEKHTQKQRQIRKWKEGCREPTLSAPLLKTPSPTNPLRNSLFLSLGFYVFVESFTIFNPNF